MIKTPMTNLKYDLKEHSRTLWREAQELNLIFAAILRRAKGGKKP